MTLQSGTRTNARTAKHCTLVKGSISTILLSVHFEGRQK